MRKTLANLEKEEDAIAEAFKAGMKHGVSMREHLHTIRKNALYEAAECENFEQYLKAERIPLSYSQGKKIARNGEVAGHIENAHTRAFSDRALEKLGTIRVENEGGSKSHDLDVPKMKKVIRRLTKDNRTLTSTNGQSQITAPMVVKAIEDVLGEKPPKPLGKQLEDQLKAIGRWCASFDALDDEFFTDAEAHYPGSVTRLAKAYSRAASILRRKLG